MADHISYSHVPLDQDAFLSPPLTSQPYMGNHVSERQQTDQRQEPPSGPEVSRSNSQPDVVSSYYMSDQGHMASSESPLNGAARQGETPILFLEREETLPLLLYAGPPFENKEDTNSTSNDSDGDGSDNELNPFLAEEEVVPLLRSARNPFESEDDKDKKDTNLISSDPDKQGDRHNDRWLNFFRRKPSGNADDEQANSHKKLFTRQLTLSFGMESSISLSGRFQERKIRKEAKHEAKGNFESKMAKAHKNLVNIEKYAESFKNAKNAFDELCKRLDAFPNGRSHPSPASQELLAKLGKFSESFTKIYTDVFQEFEQLQTATQQAKGFRDETLKQTGNRSNLDNELFEIDASLRILELKSKVRQVKKELNEINKYLQKINDLYTEIFGKGVLPSYET